MAGGVNRGLIARVVSVIGLAVLWAKFWSILHDSFTVEAKPLPASGVDDHADDDVDYVFIWESAPRNAKKKPKEQNDDDALQKMSDIVKAALGTLGIEVSELKDEEPSKKAEANAPSKKIIWGARASFDFLVSRAQESGIAKLSPDGKRVRFTLAAAETGKLKDFVKRREYFTRSERQHLILRGIQETLNVSQSIQQAKKSGLLKQFFPLHDSDSVNEMLKQWVVDPEDPDALLKVVNYFGSSIGFYFAWLTNYTEWLGVPALVSLVGFLFVPSKLNEIYFACFALYLSIHSTLLQQSWVRLCSTLQWKWRVNLIEELEASRPEFTGYYRKSPITGEQELYFPPAARYQRYAVTVPASLLAASLIGVLFFAMFEAEDRLAVLYPGSLIVYVPTILYTVLLTPITTLYNNLAHSLTSWENHRTDSAHESALIFKLVFFQFMIYYSSLFYLLFWKFDVVRLRDQLGIVFLLRQVVNNILEVGLPLITKKFSSSGESISKAYLAESKLTSYDGTFDDYLEMVIQYGYIYMFGWSFPLVAFFSYVNNIVEVRSDMFKLARGLQRPLPKESADIGQWYNVLEFFSVAGVVTNFSYLILEVWRDSDSQASSFFFPSLSIPARICALVVVEHLVFLLKVLLAVAIPDVPEEIRELRAREVYLLKNPSEDAFIGIDELTAESKESLDHNTKKIQ